MNEDDTRIKTLEEQISKQEVSVQNRSLFLLFGVVIIFLSPTYLIFLWLIQKPYQEKENYQPSWTFLATFSFFLCCFFLLFFFLVLVSLQPNFYSYFSFLNDNDFNIWRLQSINSFYYNLQIIHFMFSEVF